MNPEPEKGVRFLTPEAYAKLKDLPLPYVRKLCSATLPRRACVQKFDERDLERYSAKMVRIIYSAPTASGFSRPRLVERANPSSQRKTEAGHKSSPVPLNPSHDQATSESHPESERPSLPSQAA